MSDDNEDLLPKAALTFMLNRNRELLYFIFWYAYNNKVDFYNDRKLITGLCLAIDAFRMRDHDLIKYIIGYINKKNKLNGIFSHNPIVNNKNKRAITKIYTPDELRKILKFNHINEDKFPKDIWEMMKINYDTSINTEELSMINEFIDKVTSLRRMENILIYVQRKYYQKHFSDFANFSYFWKEHNRPWDYDHLLPKNTLHWKRDIKYKKFADIWLSSLGNYRILNFSDNRARKDKQLDCKDHEQMKFHLIENSCECFNKDTNDFNDWNETIDFAKASRDRMLKIYQQWWDDLYINKLFHEH